ncbi:hypothetical protein ACHAPU_011324 [Fusarium lateritium]
MRKIAKKVIRERREKLFQSPSPQADGMEDTRKDIITTALASDCFLEDQLVDHIMTFLVAGHESKATVFEWILYELGLRPDMQARVREEVCTHLPSPSTGIKATSLESLPYLRAVCSEVLRYDPFVPFSRRIAEKDTWVADQFIPKGTIVAYARTSRTTTARPKSCIGEVWTRAELACLVAAMVGAFEIELVEGKQADGTVYPTAALKMGKTMKLRDGVFARLRRLEDCPFAAATALYPTTEEGKYVIEAEGIRMELTKYGGAVTNLWLNNSRGEVVDVVLGLDHARDYEDYPGNPYLNGAIGTGCRFPGGSNTASKLWELLKDPKDVSKEIPTNRFNLDRLYYKDSNHHGTANVRRSYLLDEHVRLSEPQLFGNSPREAQTMDPQHRVLLEVVYEAIESAGQTIHGLQNSDTAVYVGLMCTDYYVIQAADLNPVPTYNATGVANSNASSRVSYFFNWHGPSMTIDTACASSLVAVHEAVQALRNGTSRMTVACGTNLILSPLPLICEVGVNQDGKARGITMPSAQAQASLIRQTYAKAGLDPSTQEGRCQFFEAHGTGTPAGDPQEAEALKTAFFPHDSDSKGFNGPENLGGSRL